MGLVVGLASCGPRSGTDVGNGATVSFNLRGFERAPASSAKSLKLASGDTIDEVWIAVERLRLTPGTECAESNDPVQAEGPLVADLLSQGLVGIDPPEALVKAGDYCRLQLDLHELAAEEKPATAPAELVGAALYMKGTRADGVPFSVRTTEAVEFRLRAKDTAFHIEGGVPFIIGFELSSMVAALDLGTLSGPTIVIDDTNNADRLKDFDQALKQAARLFVDENEDGDLSSGEADDAKEIAKGE